MSDSTPDNHENPRRTCAVCGALCCKLGGAVATSHEVQAIVEAGYENHFQKISNDVLITHWGTKGECPYLHDNACSIYEVRPFRCRAFPVHQDSDGRLYLSLCPISSRLDETDIEGFAQILQETPLRFLQAAASVLEMRTKTLQRRISRYPRKRISP